jgi:hypothetical protein
MDDSNYAHSSKMHTFTREALQEGETTVLQEHVMLLLRRLTNTILIRMSPQREASRARHYI